MATDSPQGWLILFEDFLRDNVTSLVETANNATQDILNRHGGWWRHDMAAAETDDVMIAGEVAWEVDEGHPLIFETRLQAASVTGVCINVGMTDANTYGSAVAPIEDENGTLATGATDAFMFLLEGEQDMTWQTVGVQSDNDNAQVALTQFADLAATTTQTLRMEANPNDSGTVIYTIRGGAGGTNQNAQVVQTSQFGSGILYAPMLCSNSRNTAYEVDFDYLYVAAPRS